MKTAVRGPCPVCESDIEFIYETDTIPYFSDILIISTLCQGCGYRYTDIQPLRGGEPARWEVRVQSEEDLSVRVVRSAGSHIRIPELGVAIDPGPACEGFVSNVEGVLDRVAKVARTLLSGSDDPSERERGEAFLQKIADVKAGSLPVTLIIEDPCGNSAIISEKAVRIPLEDPPGD